MATFPMGAGVICALAVGLKYRWGYDDSLGLLVSKATAGPFAPGNTQRSTQPGTD